MTEDSLAAESTRSGGDFAANQPGLGQPIAGVRADNTTVNTTETSGASILGPAGTKQERLTKDEILGLYQTPAGEERQGGDPYDKNSGAYNTSTGGPPESLTGAAPTAAHGDRSLTDAEAAVKTVSGAPAQEGGFSSDNPNASFNTSIGTKHDPSRVAELQFEASNAKSAMDAGYGGASAGSGQETGTASGYENLDSNERA